jgi:creatinine amidohydrolase
MQWENLTAPDFATAVKETGVCILSLGILEKHSDHLPLGTDMFIAHRLACLAAEIEPAVVFPPYYFGQIYEARCFPGTIAINPRLIYDLLQNLLDEIGRNGFKKIILYNGHGGNTHFLRFLMQAQLAEQKPYTLYMPQQLLPLTEEAEKEWTALRTTHYGGHACEEETSLMLGVNPDLVKTERIPADPAQPLNRMAGLPPMYSGIWWYADYPDHYAGDARPATAEKGQWLLSRMAERLAQYIAAVKADMVLPGLEDEFFERVANLSAS